MVKIYFSYFSTESYYDRLELRDGSSSDDQLIVSLSGIFVNYNSYYSTQSYMYVRFTTDYAVTQTGFIASFESIYAYEGNSKM